MLSEEDDSLKKSKVTADFIREFQRMARASQWTKAVFFASGVQSHMESRILVLTVGNSPHYREPSSKLRKLLLLHRTLHLDEKGRPWFFFKVTAELAIVRGGYSSRVHFDREIEPNPFGEPVPWEHLMMDDAEFPRALEHMPAWLRKRL